MSKTLIVAAGEHVEPELLQDTIFSKKAPEGPCPWIAVDGAYKTCRPFIEQNKIPKPKWVIGDFDTENFETIPTAIEIEIHPPQKDHSDTELALLKAASLGAQNCILVAEFNTQCFELDHILGHVFLVLRHGPSFEGFELRSSAGSIHWIPEKTGLSFSDVKDKPFSLFTPSEARGVYLQGSEYPLENTTLYAGTRGLSNRSVSSELVISHISGPLLLVFP
jgi:thiamine pyrophosphokinase